MHILEREKNIIRGLSKLESFLKKFFFCHWHRRLPSDATRTSQIRSHTSHSRRLLYIRPLQKYKSLYPKKNLCDWLGYSMPTDLPLQLTSPCSSWSTLRTLSAVTVERGSCRCGPPVRSTERGANRGQKILPIKATATGPRGPVSSRRQQGQRKVNDATHDAGTAWTTVPGFGGTCSAAAAATTARHEQQQLRQIMHEPTTGAPMSQ